MMDETVKLSRSVIQEICGCLGYDASTFGNSGNQVDYGRNLRSDESFVIRQHLRKADKTCLILGLYFKAANEANNSEKASEIAVAISGMWDAITKLLSDPTLSNLAISNFEEHYEAANVLANRLFYTKDHIQHNNDQFKLQSPKRRKTQSKILKNPTLQLKNKFSVLDPEAPPPHCDITDDANMDTAPLEIPSISAEDVDNRNSSQVHKSERTEPFYIQLSANWRQTQIEINEKVVDNKIKAKLSGDLVKVQTQTISDYRKLQAYLLHNDIPFHALAPRTERPVKILIRGLHTFITSTEIQEEIEELGFQVISVVPLLDKKSKEHMNLTLLQIQPTKNWDTIFEITTIAGMEVQLKKFYNRGIKQCYRCQKFNHSSATCSLPPRCVKCTDPHLTKDCLKPKDQPPTCCNCGGPHPASYRGCVKNPENIPNQSRNQTKINNNKFTPAPANPAWPNPKKLFSNQSMQSKPKSWGSLTEEEFPTLLKETTNSQKKTSATASEKTSNSNSNCMGEVLNTCKILKDLFAGLNLPLLLKTLQTVIQKISTTEGSFNKMYVLFESLDSFASVFTCHN